MHSTAREDGDAFRANQISSISPGIQWGDRWHNQNSFRVSTGLREDGASVWYQTVTMWNGSPGLGPHQCSNQDRAGSGSNSRSYCLSVPQEKVGPDASDSKETCSSVGAWRRLALMLSVPWQTFGITQPNLLSSRSVACSPYRTSAIEFWPSTVQLPFTNELSHEWSHVTPHPVCHWANLMEVIVLFCVMIS